MLTKENPSTTKWLPRQLSEYRVYNITNDKLFPRGRIKSLKNHDIILSYVMFYNTYTTGEVVVCRFFHITNSLHNKLRVENQLFHLVYFCCSRFSKEFIITISLQIIISMRPINNIRFYVFFLFWFFVSIIRLQFWQHC